MKKRVVALSLALLIGVLFLIPSAKAETDPIQVTNLKLTPSTIAYKGFKPPNFAHLSYETNVATQGNLELINSQNKTILSDNIGDYHRFDTLQYSYDISAYFPSIDDPLPLGDYQVKLTLRDAENHQKVIEVGTLTIVAPQKVQNLIQDLDISQVVISPQYKKDEELTEISFDLARKSEISLRIFNSTGATVRSWDGTFEPGHLSFPWNGLDQKGIRVVDGKYTFKIWSHDLEYRYSPMNWEDPSWTINVEGVGSAPLPEWRVKEMVPEAHFKLKNLVPNVKGQDQVDLKFTTTEKAIYELHFLDDKGNIVYRYYVQSNLEPGEHTFTIKADTFLPSLLKDGVYHLNVWAKEYSGSYGSYTYPGEDLIVKRDPEVITPQFATITADKAEVFKDSDLNEVISLVYHDDIFVINKLTKNSYRAILANGVTGYIPSAVVKPVTLNKDSFPLTRLYAYRVSWYQTDGEKVIFFRDEAQNNLYVLDLKTGAKKKFVNDATHKYQNPVISGNYLAWTENQNGKIEIIIHNLATNQENKLETSFDSAPLLKMTGGFLIYWQQDKGGVYLYSVSTGENKQLTPNQAVSASTDGEFVVWTEPSKLKSNYYSISDSVYGEFPIVVGNVKAGKGLSGTSVYNLKTGETNAFISIGSTGVVDFDGDKVAQIMAPNVNKTPEVYLYDFDALQNISLTEGSIHRPQNVQIKENKVFYLSDGYLIMRELHLGKGSLISIPAMDLTYTVKVISDYAKLYKDNRLDSVIRLVHKGETFNVYRGIYNVQLPDGSWGYISEKDAILVDGYPEVFNDIGTHWARKDILDMVAEGIVQGTTPTSFAPDSKITRAQFITLLVRALHLQDNPTETPFKDVPINQWYFNPVVIAYKNGLVNGSNGYFRPNDLISRQEIALMLVRALNKEGINLPHEDASLILKPFTDRNKVSSWAQDGLVQAVSLGLINGRGKDTIAPLANASRAEGVVMIKRFLGKI